MTIKREIDNKIVEIVLSDRELEDAYFEQQAKYDEMDTSDLFTCMDDEDLLDCYELSRKEIEKLIPQIAYEKRRLQNKYDLHWDTARDEAAYSVIRQYKEGRL